MEITVTATTNSGASFPVVIKTKNRYNGGEVDAWAVLGDARAHGELLIQDGVEVIRFGKYAKEKVMVFVGAPAATIKAVMADKNQDVCLNCEWKAAAKKLAENLAIAQASHIPTSVGISHHSREFSVTALDAEYIHGECAATDNLAAALNEIRQVCGVQKCWAILGGMSTGDNYWTGDYHQILDNIEDLAAAELAAAAAKATDAKAARIAEHAAFFAEAAQTGKAVKIFSSSYCDTVHDGEVWVTSTRWAMPDGTEKTTSSEVMMD